MKFIDFHCDTLYKMLHKDGDNMDDTLVSNKGHIDLSRLNDSGTIGQCFAAFINMRKEPVGKSHYNDVYNMFDILEEGVVRDNRYIIVKDNISIELNKSLTDDTTKCILTVEEGGILEDDLSRLEELYIRGVRIITLTWNYENCIGFPNAAYKYKDCGLKDFGIDVVRKMDELGIVIDVSHLSDQGFWDVIQHGKRPIIATHSNARALMEHPRNLTDDMIQAISKSKGVIGLNYYGAFLQENGKCDFEIMCRHIDHITKVGGMNILALGSDFDGIDCELPMRGVEDLDLFAEAMVNYGFTQEQVEGFCYKNAIEFFDRYENGIR